MLFTERSHEWLKEIPNCTIAFSFCLGEWWSKELGVWDLVVLTWWVLYLVVFVLGGFELSILTWWFLYLVVLSCQFGLVVNLDLVFGTW